MVFAREASLEARVSRRGPAADPLRARRRQREADLARARGDAQAPGGLREALGAGTALAPAGPRLPGLQEERSAMAGAGARDARCRAPPPTARVQRVGAQG
jgi:hypothetical protein